MAFVVRDVVEEICDICLDAFLAALGEAMLFSRNLVCALPAEALDFIHYSVEVVLQLVTEGCHLHGFGVLFEKRFSDRGGKAHIFQSDYLLELAQVIVIPTNYSLCPCWSYSFKFAELFHVRVCEGLKDINFFLTVIQDFELIFGQFTAEVLPYVVGILHIKRLGDAHNLKLLTPLLVSLKGEHYPVPIPLYEGQQIGADTFERAQRRMPEFLGYLAAVQLLHGYEHYAEVPVAVPVFL